MLTPIRYRELGQFQNDWLHAHYHFSFSEYRNPERMGLGVLRVINDDIVAAGGGFDFHPHRDMEIITYVRRGAITHRDSLGNEGRTAAGDVQVMSAGTGIIHSEENREGEATNLYQIWIHPRQKNVTPRWEQRAFPKMPVQQALSLLVSGRAEDEAKGALYIHQDAAIYGGRLKEGTSIAHPVGEAAYLLVAIGTVEVNGHTLAAGDGLSAEEESTLRITALEETEVLVIDVPTHVGRTA